MYIWFLKGREIFTTKDGGKMKNKITLEKEKKRIVERIKIRSNRLLLDTYLDLKRLLDINKELESKEGIYGISKRIGYNPEWVTYILSLDALKEESWLNKLSTQIILYVLNYSEKAVKEQEEIFKKIKDKNQEEIKRFLELRYKVEEEEDEEQVPIVKKPKKTNYVYNRARRDLDRVNISILLINNFTKLTKKEKETLRVKIEELEKNIKRVLNGSLK